jgi:hypothetical protein
MNRLELDEFDKGEDWALAETTARIAVLKKSKARRINNIQKS